MQLSDTATPLRAGCAKPTTSVDPVLLVQSAPVDLCLFLTGARTCCGVLLQVQAASDRCLAELGRHNYVTLTSYLQLLSSFKSMLEAKRTANTNARKRYTVGLEKLASSASQVAGMQAELVAMQPQLVTTVAEVEELMTRIAQEKKVRRHIWPAQCWGGPF